MRLALSCVLLAATASGIAHAQPPPPNPTVDPVHVAITEPVKDSATKIASEFDGARAMIASEPANHEFVALTPDETATVTPETGMRDIEHMLMRETEKVRKRIDLPLSQKRIGTIKTPILIQGRNSDELQGIFRLSYDLLVEGGKTAEWKTYEHPIHGFVYVRRNKEGAYTPDPVQLEAVKDSMVFFDKYLNAK